MDIFVEVNFLAIIVEITDLVRQLSKRNRWA